MLGGVSEGLLIARKIRHSSAWLVLQDCALFHPSVVFRTFSMIASALGFMLAAQSASAMQLSPEQNELYTSVSINPPSATEMTVCYGFVCRRRATLDFSDADRKTLTQILSTGKASPAAERAAVQKAVVWFDKRMGPMIGTTIFATAPTPAITIAGTRPVTCRASCWCCRSGAC